MSCYIQVCYVMWWTVQFVSDHHCVVFPVCRSWSARQLRSWALWTSWETPWGSSTMSLRACLSSSSTATWVASYAMWPTVCPTLLPRYTSAELCRIDSLFLCLFNFVCSVFTRLFFVHIGASQIISFECIAWLLNYYIIYIILLYTVQVFLLMCPPPEYTHKHIPVKTHAVWTSSCSLCVSLQGLYQTGWGRPWTTGTRVSESTSDTTEPPVEST